MFQLKNISVHFPTAAKLACDECKVKKKKTRRDTRNIKDIETKKN